MKGITLLSHFSKIIFGSAIFVYTTLIFIVFTSSIVGTTTTNGETTSESSLTEEDIESIGVQWKYERSDSDVDEDKPTCWKLRWSPDGSMIAVVYFDNTTIILNSRTGKPVAALGTSADEIMGGENGNTRARPESNSGSKSRCFGFTNNPKIPLLRACAWSPDGKLLAVAGDHTLIEIFNTSTWKSVKVLKGHTGSVLSLAWSPDGVRLASGEGTDQVLIHNEEECKNVVKIWNTVTGSELRTLTGHKDGVMSLRWSKNGSKLVSTGDAGDRNLLIWDTTDYTLLSTLGEGLGHSSGVLDADWSPNQTYLISGSRDYKIRLWDAINGTPIGKPWKDHNCVRSTHWHPSGKYILTAGVDQSIKIRNASTGKEIKIFEEASETNSEVMSARWSPDGTMFAACSTIDATVRLYGLGFSEEEGAEDDKDRQLGIPIFIIIAIIGLILIYIPLRREFRERKK